MFAEGRQARLEARLAVTADPVAGEDPCDSSVVDDVLKLLQPEAGSDGEGLSSAGDRLQQHDVGRFDPLGSRPCRGRGGRLDREG